MQKIRGGLVNFGLPFFAMSLLSCGLQVRASVYPISIGIAQLATNRQRPKEVRFITVGADFIFVQIMVLLLRDSSIAHLAQLVKCQLRMFWRAYCVIL